MSALAIRAVLLIGMAVGAGLGVVCTMLVYEINRLEIGHDQTPPRASTQRPPDGPQRFPAPNVRPGAPSLWRWLRGGFWGWWTMSDPQSMATALRALGWTCVPPAAEAPPEPAVGQVWVAAKTRTLPRTVMGIGTCPWWPSEAVCVFFRTPGHKQGERDSVLPPWSWRSWVSKSGARPL